MMSDTLTKKFKSLGPPPDFEAPPKQVGPDKMRSLPEGGGTQGHPAKDPQPLNMKFIE